VGCFVYKSTPPRPIKFDASGSLNATDTTFRVSIAASTLGVTLRGIHETHRRTAHGVCLLHFWKGLAMDRRRFCLTALGSGTLSLGALAGVWAYSPPAIRWHKDLKSAHRVAVEQNRPMLILFSASWCTYCHKLQRETLGEKPMVAFVEQQFVPLLLDYDKDNAIAKILEVESLPCTVVLSPQADLLARLVGYAKSGSYRETLQAALDTQQRIRQVSATNER
jgi:thiol-disulfide isomerase/thioredoxin